MKARTIGRCNWLVFKGALVYLPSHCSTFLAEYYNKIASDLMEATPVHFYVLLSIKHDPIALKNSKYCHKGEF